MANVLVEEQVLKNVTDEIRKISGKTDLMKPAEMSTELSKAKENLDSDYVAFVEGTGSKLPEGATKIKDYCFSHSQTIENLDIPSNVKKVGKYICDYSPTLRKVKINSELAFPNGGYQFQLCTNLEQVEGLENLTTIPSSMFYGCELLKIDKLPNLRTLGQSCFYGCKKLAIKEIPESVTSISYSAFSNCTGLTELTFKGTIGQTAIESTSFNGCTNLTVIRVPWAEGAVNKAPWGATNATIIYNWKEE